MNERIKELLAKLDIDLYTDKGVMMTKILVSPKDLRQFAELIVQECMRQVEEQYKPVLEDETMMKDTHWGGYVQCGVDSYVAIREHFFGEEL